MDLCFYCDSDSEPNGFKVQELNPLDGKVWVNCCADCYNELYLIDKDFKNDDYYKNKIDQKLKNLGRSYAWLYYNKLEGQ